MLMIGIFVATAGVLCLLLRRLPDRGSGWRPVMIWIAGAIWLASFFMPVVDFGGPARRAANGFLAAFFACYILPASLLTARHGHVALSASLYGIVVGVAFLLLAAFNAVMILAIAVRRCGPALRKLLAAAAILVWFVPLVSIRTLYAALELANPEQFSLQFGYFLWAASFGLLAVGCGVFTRSRETAPGKMLE